MSNKDMAAALAAIVALLQQQGVTVPTKPVKGKRKAEPKAKRKVTPEKKANYLALKAKHGGKIPREVYLAAKTAGQIG
jgi:hypothetical protein